MRFIFLRLLNVLLISAYFLFHDPTFAQTSSTGGIKKIYAEAEKLYLRNNFQGSLDYIETNGKSLAVASDSLLYLKIINMDHIYKNSSDNTRRLEALIIDFSGRVRKYIFPDNKYSEVVSIYTKVLQFKETDKRFYENAKIEANVNSIIELKYSIDKINTYLASNKNSYYIIELTEIISKKTAMIAQIEKENLARQRDSTFTANSKLVGKKTVLTLSYAIPTQNHSMVLANESELMEMLGIGGNTNPIIVPDLALQGSLFDFCGNLFTYKRFKIGMIFTMLDFSYHVINFDKNTILQKSATDSTKLKQIISMNAGTRIGLMASYLLTKKIAIAPYIQVIPAVNFLSTSMGYEKKNIDDGSIGRYKIQQKFDNFNFSTEYGLRFYFFERLYLSFFVQNNIYNWASIITRNLISGSEVNIQANHKFQTYGIKIGL